MMVNTEYGNMMHLCLLDSPSQKIVRHSSNTGAAALAVSAPPRVDFSHQGKRKAYRSSWLNNSRTLCLTHLYMYSLTHTLTYLYIALFY